MITNLITLALAATISTRLETNIISGDNHRGCSAGNTSYEVSPGIWSTTLLYHPSHEGCTPYVPATASWEITRVSEVQTLKLDWNGPREIEHRTILSSVTNYMEMKTEWIKTTNRPPILDAIWFQGRPIFTSNLLYGVESKWSVDLSLTNVTITNGVTLTNCVLELR